MGELVGHTLPLFVANFGLNLPRLTHMASTSGSLEMSLRKFVGLNFNFWKE